MATLFDLKLHLKNDGKIKRHFWEEGAFIKLIGNTFVCEDGLEYPFSPEDALYCDWEVYDYSFKITHTGIYKTRDGSKTYVSFVENRLVHGVFEGDFNIQNWGVDGSWITGKKSDKDIVSEWED